MAVLLYQDYVHYSEGRWPFFNSFVMSANHKNPPHGNRREEGLNREDGKQADINSGIEEGQDDRGSGSGESIRDLESTITELREKNLRLLAEFDNYKKRTSRERYELLSSASKDVILALLPVIDDFERALKTDVPQDESFREGVRMIYNRMLNVLQSQGLKAMESTGETFDPDLHDAITDVPASDDSLKGKVIDTIEKGYMLNDKIIRHAKVVVGK